jgi:hypothetical protein
VLFWSLDLGRLELSPSLPINEVRRLKTAATLSP